MFVSQAYIQICIDQWEKDISIEECVKGLSRHFSKGTIQLVSKYKKVPNFISNEKCISKPQWGRFTNLPEVQIKKTDNTNTKYFVNNSYALSSKDKDLHIWQLRNSISWFIANKCGPLCTWKHIQKCL